MRVARGTVVSGKGVLNESSLPEGAKVYVLSGESNLPLAAAPAIGIVALPLRSTAVLTKMRASA